MVVKLTAEALSPASSRATAFAASSPMGSAWTLVGLPQPARTKQARTASTNIFISIFLLFFSFVSYLFPFVGESLTGIH